MMALSVLVLLLAGCGAQTTATDPGGGSDTTPPAQPSPPPGPVTTRQPVTVLDDGDGAELCLGGVAESWPPQCGGPKLIGWDWADQEGYYEEGPGLAPAEVVRWGEFKVTGTFDGTDIRVIDAIPAMVWQGPAPEHDVDFSSPCPEPPGGWPDEPMPMFADNAAFEAAHRLPDYAGGWLTNRDPRSADELDQASADDPGLEILPPIVNIRITGDVDAAEAAIRAVWDGPLCVVGAEHTLTELRRIQDELYSATHGALTAAVDERSGVVELHVTYDDGTLQSQADERYGAGVVRVTSALVPAD